MARQGQVRLLAVAAPARLPDVLAEVPTWREQGYDAVVSNWRGMVGPKGMSPAQIAYWEQALLRFTESEEWKKELEKNFWQSEYMRGADMRKYLDQDNAEARAFLTELGLAK
jgi:putative tricarboxylic transport membrane protein